MRSDWFLPICTGAERLKDADGRKTHPTQKPEALLAARPARRLQRRRSRARSVLRLRHDRRRRPPARPPLTSAWSATRSTPHAARARIAAVEPLPAEALAPTPTQAQRTARRLCEPHRGGPGSPGRDAGRRRAAAIAPSCAPTAPSTLGPAVGSIHKIGALAQGLPACNGWTFWRVERGGGRVPIDDLRAERARADARGGGIASPYPGVTFDHKNASVRQKRGVSRVGRAP